MKPQSYTVFDVEPFGHELKAEWLRRNEGFSVFSNRMFSRGPLKIHIFRRDQTDG